MALLSKQEILDADDISKELVSVPEWGGEVYVGMLTGAERDRFEELSMKGKGKDREVNLANFRARLAAAVIVDGNGNRMFSETEINVLGAKSAAALDRVYEAGTKLNRISKEDVDAAVGNSESDQSDDSGSDSPAN